jgi:hypothetical protein
MEGLGIDNDTASSEIARYILEDQLERGVHTKTTTLQDLRCKIAMQLDSARPSQPGLVPSKADLSDFDFDDEVKPLQKIS